jgi:hypothetical protein
MRLLFQKPVLKSTNIRKNGHSPEQSKIKVEIGRSGLQANLGKRQDLMYKTTRAKKAGSSGGGNGSNGRTPNL